MGTVGSRGRGAPGGRGPRALGVPPLVPSPPDGTCEIKWLFVHDRFRGQGIGRRLCTALIEAARANGFELMRLDTGDRLTEALGMYTSVGFVDAAPHHAYPDDLMPYLVFMERPLADAARY